MPSRLLAPLLVVAALLVAGLAWWTFARERGPGPDTVGANEPADGPAVLAAPSSGPEDAGEVGIGPPESDAPERAAVAAPAEDDVARDDLLTGEVRDPSGEPIAGANVGATRRTVPGPMNTLDLEEYRTLLPVGTTETGLDGTFALAVPTHRALELTVDAPPYASAVRAGVFGGEHVTITLVDGAVVEGRAVDAETRLGVRDVPLRIWGREPGRVLVSGRTDAGGGFRFDGLPAGRLWLMAKPTEYVDPSSRLLTLEPGQVERAEIELQRGFTAFGTVVDAPSGEPLAGAEVSQEWNFERVVHTDADGRYELSGYGGNRVYLVYARAPGHGKIVRRLPEIVEPNEDQRVDFALPPGHAVIGRVVDPGDTPRAGVYVAAVASKFGPGPQRVEWQAARTGEDGRFRMEDLTPDLRHKLLLRAAGLAETVYDFPPDEADHALLDLGTIVLGPGGRLVGVVVDDDGEPRPGLWLELTLRRADEDRWLPEDETPWQLNYTDRVESATDSRGRFHFTDLAAGRHTIAVQERGRDRLDVQPSLTVELGPGEARDDLVLVAGRGLAIGGVVLDPEGAPVRGVAVRVLTGDGALLSTRRTDAQGHFQITGVLSGRYRLRADARELARYDALERALYDAVLDDVAAGSADVQLVLRPGAFVSGTVLAADGAPAAEVLVVALDPAGGAELDAHRLDAEGHFRLVLPEGAAADLETRHLLTRPDGGSRPAAPDPARDAPAQRVAAGTADVVLRLAE